MEVSRCGYYAWKHRRPSKRHIENEKLREEVREIFYQYRKRYGSIRITDELRDRGKLYNKKRIVKLLAGVGALARNGGRLE